MSVKRDQLLNTLHEFLNVDGFKDYCPNGLQVEGRVEINKIVTGVTASLQLIEAAVASQADLLLVHHGYFWKGEPQPLTGIKGQRVKCLMQADLNLVAYHLPLDAHPQLGNNQQLAEVLGIQVVGSMEGDAWPLGLIGELPKALSASAFAGLIKERLGREPLHLKGHQRPLRKIAWCTGAAEGGIYRAAELGADAYISGEVSERTLHEARELGIDYFAAGHHATERYGVKALGEWLAREFAIEQEFIDLENPV